jgi:hypothetical protein
MTQALWAVWVLVSSDGDACVRWITRRAAWEDVGARTEGDGDVLADPRGLKVF